MLSSAEGRSERHFKRPGPPALLSLLSCLLLLVALAPGLLSQETLSASEARGKLLYTTGEAPDGRDIIAVLGEGGTEVPASALPCVGCHGRRGIGNAEGGISPSNIQWESLTRPDGVVGANGRKHPPYTASTFKRAVGMGMDAGGNPLQAAMPRYRLTQEESADLLAYLQKISSELDPGVSARALRVGVVLPPPGALGTMASGVRAALTARFDLLNQGGGLYGRTLELAFIEPPAEGWRRRSAVNKFLEEEKIFALLASYMAGAEPEMAALASVEGVPSIGPFSLQPQVSTPLNPWVFYLESGLEQQARALVQYSSDPSHRGVATRLVVLHPQNESLAAIRAAIEAQVKAVGEDSWTEVTYRPFSADAPIDLQTTGSSPLGDDLLFVGTESQTSSLLAALVSSTWRPRIFLLGPLAGSAPLQVSQAQADRLFIAQPSLPSDRTRQALQIYQQLRGDALGEEAAEPASPDAEIAALASAEILIEALRRVGKAVSRQGLVDVLETFYDFRTGMAPPVTFSANRRIGALGAYIVRPKIDAGQYVALGPWVTPE